MTNPRTLVLAIAATACGLCLALVGVSSVAPAPPGGGSAQAARPIVAELKEVTRQEPASIAVDSKPIRGRVVPPIDADPDRRP